MCALSVEDALLGGGEQLCFVSAEAAFFLVFVSHGEGIAGESFRYGLGTLWPNQLAKTEAEACAAQIALLEVLSDAPEGSVSGVRSYVPCE